MHSSKRARMRPKSAFLIDTGVAPVAVAKQVGGKARRASDETQYRDGTSTEA